MYQLTTGNTIALTLANGNTLFLPATNNGTPEWRDYQAWLKAGNRPKPAPTPTPPPPLTAEQKLAAAGLSVAELRQLLGPTS